jgi:NADH dehydrogenase
MRDGVVPHIVVAGGGFGGSYAVRELEKRLGRRARVTLVDRQNFFVFYPLLIEAGTGNLEPRHAVIPIRSFLDRGRFVLGAVTGLDPERRRLFYRPGGDDAETGLDYDHLVIALGSVTRLPPVPGLDEHGFQIKSLAQAVGLRDRAIRMLELAETAATEAARRELLHFVVVGANFTGAELAGEFDVFLKEASRSYRNVTPGDCRVTLVELADRILGALEPELAAYATRTMRERGIDIRLGTSVDAIDPRHADLSTGERLASRTVIWCAGIAPAPALERLPLPKNDLGYLLCEPDLRVRGFENLWGVGDIAVNPGPDGKAYPATAQHAVRQGKAAARNIAAVLEGRPTRPHEFKDQGSIAALGCRTGVAKVFGIRVSGFWAWFLFRTVYLLKMPGLGRKIRVALDWSMDLFFRPDYVSLGVHRGRNGDDQP